VPAVTVGDDVLDLGEDGLLRCSWAGGTALYRQYHDDEWGHPVVADQRLFEKLCLEGFQAGLSWLTILRKREAFRTAFAGFDAGRVAQFGPEDVERLLTDPGIVRHRGKITSTVNNAARALDLAAECGTIAAYVWSYEPSVELRPVRVTREWVGAHPTSPESAAMSKDLKRRGWTFVGPTTVYAFMQAMGLVNDHQDACFARARVEAARAALTRPATTRLGR